MGTSPCATKGQLNGVCNRSACDRGPADHYNDQTRAYYCAPCARSINAWSRIDAGREICHRDPEGARPDRAPHRQPAPPPSPYNISTT